MNVISSTTEVTKYLVIKASTAHHRQVFVCAIKVFQLAKTYSEIIAGDIFRPDACSVMFVCSRMDSGYEHVRSCGKRLQKEKEKLKGKASIKAVLAYSNAKRKLKETMTAMPMRTSAVQVR